MIRLATQWSDNMRSGKILREDAWLAINSTILHTLSYPLPALNLSRDQCEAIMCPILFRGLPAMGICRTFPRDVIFVLWLYMGLGFKHLHTEQELLCIKDIIFHMHLMTDRSLGLFLVELGFNPSCQKEIIPLISSLTTNSLIKSTYLFLLQYDITLKHTLEPVRNRENDQCIMDVFLEYRVTLETMLSLNRCRLFLHALYLSNITTGDGLFIAEDACNGHHNLSINRVDSWPRLGRPSRSDWVIWRHCIARCFLSRGRRLRCPLGDWVRSDPTWQCFYHPNTDSLFSRSDQSWYTNRHRPRRFHFFYFSQQGSLMVQLPSLLLPAMVFKNSSCYILSEFSKPYTSIPVGPAIAHSFSQYLTERVHEHWCFEHFRYSDEGRLVASAIRSGTAVMVSDGSYK